jgi:hypothetical protein
VTALGAGQPEQVGSRYYDDDHGVRTEITRSRYDAENAASSRIFAGAVVAFAGFALLTLTADRSELHREDTERLRVATAQWSGTRPEARGSAAGARMLQGEVASDLDSLIRHLRLTVPISVSGSAARAVVTASWAERGFAFDRAIDLWLVGTAEQTLRGTSTVHLEVRPSEARWAAPTRARIVALCVGLPLAIAALLVLAVLGFPAALIGILFLVVSAINLSLRWGSTFAAVRRATRVVAAAVGLPAP